MKSGFKKILSILLLATYFVLLAIPVLHFHPVNLNSRQELLDSNSQTATAADPFQNSNSECSVTQLASITYLNDFFSPHSERVFTSEITLKFLYDSTKSLQIIFDSNGLRAPPAIS